MWAQTSWGACAAQTSTTPPSVVDVAVTGSYLTGTFHFSGIAACPAGRGRSMERSGLIQWAVARRFDKPRDTVVVLVLG